MSLCNQCNHHFIIRVMNGYSKRRCRKDVKLYKSNRDEHYGNSIDIEECEYVEITKGYSIKHTTEPYDVGVTIDCTALYLDNNRIMSKDYKKYTLEEMMEFAKEKGLING